MRAYASPRGNEPGAVVTAAQPEYAASVRAISILLAAAFGASCGRVGFATDDGHTDDAPPQQDAPPTEIRFRMDDSPLLVGNMVVAEPAQFSVGCGARCPTLVPGKVGQAFRFDKLRLELGQLINWAQPFTVTVWLRPDAVIAGNETVVPVSKAWSVETGLNEVSLIFVNNNFVGFEGNRSNIISFSSSTLNVRTAWHHFALVWDGTQRQLHIDGIGYDPQLGPWGVGAEPLAIGADLDSGLVKFAYAGDIDDLRIFTRALTTVELVALIQEL